MGRAVYGRSLEPDPRVSPKHRLGWHPPVSMPIFEALCELDGRSRIRPAERYPSVLIGADAGKLSLFSDRPLFRSLEAASDGCRHPTLRPSRRHHHADHISARFGQQRRPSPDGNSAAAEFAPSTAVMQQHKPPGANSSRLPPFKSRLKAFSIRRLPNPRRDGGRTGGPPLSRQLSLS